jgi:hypothetical protein
MSSLSYYQGLLAAPRSYSLAHVKSKAAKSNLRVCILSPHPLVLAEFSRALAPPGFQTVTRHLDSMLGPELRKLAVPRAPGFDGQSPGAVAFRASADRGGEIQ